MKKPRKAIVLLTLLVFASAGETGLAGCSGESEPAAAVPPTPPVHRLAGAVLPAQAAGYTALGDFPVSGQTEATYVLNSDPFALAVVTVTDDPEVGETTFDADGWFGASHCGLFDAGASEDSQQAGCVVPLVDGFLTVVGSNAQSPEQLSELANALYEALP
ncbi:MAG: hypothetical protein LBI84_08365 [Propionibacteriaceae bacterium]|jgi:hypothetical protein|nr:hypothetical protein [Propionibacteriaceae bacterium]